MSTVKFNLLSIECRISIDLVYPFLVLDSLYNYSSFSANLYSGVYLDGWLEILSVIYALFSTLIIKEEHGANSSFKFR